MGPPAAATAHGSVSSFADAIERYQHNWVGHVLVIGSHLSRRTVERLERECDYAQIRPRLGSLLSLVWREARPLTELAAQLAVSRQACSKIVRIAEEGGYVERIPALGGHRAQCVRLTKRGRELAEDSIRLIFEEQASYERWLGAERMQRFNAASSALFYALGLHQRNDAALGEAARRSIGVLPLVADRLEQELRERTRAKGHGGLQLSHARLIALIGDGERSVSEMARAQGVSRQATGVTVRSLESLGYVEREIDETDTRAIRVRLSERGVALVFDTLTALDELEAELRASLGPRRFDDLVDVASELRFALTLAEECFEGADAVASDGEPVARGRSEPPDRELRAIATMLEAKLGANAADRLGRLLCDGTATARA